MWRTMLAFVFTSTSFGLLYVFDPVGYYCFPCKKLIFCGYIGAFAITDMLLGGKQKPKKVSPTKSENDTVYVNLYEHADKIDGGKSKAELGKSPRRPKKRRSINLNAPKQNMV